MTHSARTVLLDEWDARPSKRGLRTPRPTALTCYKRMNENVDAGDLRALERYLLRLSIDEGIGSEGACNVQLEVLEAGSWIIKLRRHGIVVNNCELVLRDGIKIDASISFFTLGNFWATINGSMSLEEGAMSTSGSELAMHLFRTKVLKSKSPMQHPATTTSLLTTAGSTATSPLPATPTNRVLRPSSIGGEDKLPLRSGWLLKKRDLFTGWRSRYFKLYVGRVEYFVEPGDPLPRASINLLNAKITPASEIRINGQGRSYQIMVEPKKSEKCFKLASELTGEDGKQDAESWFMAFDIATKPPAQAHALLSGTKASPSPHVGVTDRTLGSPARREIKSGKSGLATKEADLQGSTRWWIPLGYTGAVAVFIIAIALYPHPNAGTVAAATLSLILLIVLFRLRLKVDSPSSSLSNLSPPSTPLR